MEIKVLGPGCAKCQQAEKIVQKAVNESGVAADVEKITGLMKIAAYGVFGTPAVVVDGQVEWVARFRKRKRFLHGSSSFIQAFTNKLGKEYPHKLNVWYLYMWEKNRFWPRAMESGQYLSRHFLMSRAGRCSGMWAFSHRPKWTNNSQPWELKNEKSK